VYGLDLAAIDDAVNADLAFSATQGLQATL
jgi:hypothetical protein